MFSVEPYLLFNGDCEEAFHFYKTVFGGEFSDMMRYKDMPEQSEKFPDELKDKILHVSLPLGKGVLLMGSDAGPGPNSVNKGNNIVLTLDVDDEEEAKRLFEKLSKEGKIIMPLEKTFWAELYAMFTDKFGINWSINYGFEKKQ